MVTLKKIQHRDAPRIGIYFGYDDRLKQSARRIGARWSQTQRCWYLDEHKIHIKQGKGKKRPARDAALLDSSRIAGLS